MISYKSLFAAVVLLFHFSTSMAASVSAVKEQKVLINLEGDETSEGDEFFLINPETTKKTAIIRIKQVKNGKALADIVKGKAAPGYTLQAKATAPISKDASAQGDDSGAGSYSAPTSLKDSYGVLGSYLMNSMDADVSYKDILNNTKTASTSMSGSGFGVGGFYDYTLTSLLAAHGAAIFEQFDVSGTASAAACSSSTNCDAKINYLSFYGSLKWYPAPAAYRLWISGGGGFLLAVSKSSTALNESQISTNQVFTVGAGCDIQMGRKNYIPVSLEYNLFPASDTVKASTIAIRAGWAWNL